MIYENAAMAGMWPDKVDRASLAQLLSVLEGRRKLALAQAGRQDEDDVPTGAELDAFLVSQPGGGADAAR